MAEYEQVPMFDPNSNLHPREQLLFRLVEMQAETVRIQAAYIAALQANGTAKPSEPSTGAAEIVVRESQSHPTNPRWRTWRGFVLDLQRLAALVKAPRVTKEAVAMLGPDSAKTITRVMEAYGLDPGDWPPERWDPDEPDRVYRPRKGDRRTT